MCLLRHNFLLSLHNWLEHLYCIAFGVFLVYPSMRTRIAGGLFVSHLTERDRLKVTNIKSILFERCFFCARFQILVSIFLNLKSRFQLEIGLFKLNINLASFFSLSSNKHGKCCLADIFFILIRNSNIYNSCFTPWVNTVS